MVMIQLKSEARVIMKKKVMLMTQPRVIHSVIMIEKVMLMMIQLKSEARDKKRGGRWTAEVIYSTFGQKLPPPSHLKKNCALHFMRFGIEQILDIFNPCIQTLYKIKLN